MSSAVGKLDAVLLSISLLIIIFIWLFIINPSGTTAELVPIATIVLGFSFGASCNLIQSAESRLIERPCWRAVFGNSAKNLFEVRLLSRLICGPATDSFGRRACCSSSASTRTTSATSSSSVRRRP